MKHIFLRKSVSQIQAEAQSHGLKRTLGKWNLVSLGIGCIIGADTYPGRESDDLLQVYSVAPVIADELKGYFRLH